MDRGVETLKLHSARVAEKVEAGLYTARSAMKEQYEQALVKLNIDERDLAKLDHVKLIMGVMGVVINLLLMASQTYEAWFKGTAIFGGQPFDVYASLGYVSVGMAGQDTKYFAPSPCPSGSDACPISSLCAFSPPSSTFPNGAPKYTEQEVWCQLDGAGRTATLFLWVGLLAGLAATALTLIYASKDIDMVGAKITELVGFVSDETQKRAIGGCWAAWWGFMLVAMISVSSLLPGTLGIGPVYMESSFGLLRLCFLLTTLCGSILITSLFKLWDANNVAEAWAEFVDTKFLSAKKALYFLLMFQVVCYLLLTVADFQWELLLAGILFYYVDTRKKNFLLTYLVFVAISLILDAVDLMAVPSANVTPGESFCASILTLVFLSKFAVLGSLYLFQKELEATEGGYQAQVDHAGAGDDEIAE